MTISERGVYRELLDECWQRGAIPDDMEKLAEICGCSLPEMAAAWPTVRKCFEPIDGMDGMYLTSQRLELERTEQDAKRAKAALSGRLGGIAKASLANAKQSPYSSSSSSEQSKSSSTGELAPLAPSGGAACSQCGGRKGLHAPACPHANP